MSACLGVQHAALRARPSLAPPSPPQARNSPRSTSAPGRSARDVASTAYVRKKPPGFPTERQRAHYAILHDFCMSIPYSGFIFLWGLKLCIFNSFVVGVLHVIAAAMVAACSVYSLQLWKRGLGSLMSQLISATTAMYVAWIWGLKWRIMLTGQPTWGPMMFTEPFVLSFVSTIFALFIVYNRMAGGNPPPKRLQEAEPTETEADVRKYWREQQ